jgi:hypothetical protein
MTFQEEYRRLLESHRVEFDERTWARDPPIEMTIKPSPPRKRGYENALDSRLRGNDVTLEGSTCGTERRAL